MYTETKKRIEEMAKLLRDMEWELDTEQHRATLDQGPRKSVAADMYSGDHPLPLKTRGKLEGRWYIWRHPDLKIKSAVVFAVYKGDKTKTYGANDQMGWLDSVDLNWDLDGWRLATEEEVKNMLVSEARRRYDGKYISMGFDVTVPFNDIDELTFAPSRNALCAHHNASGITSDLFYNGWVDPKYKEKSELPKIHGYVGRDLGYSIKYGCFVVTKEFIRSLGRVKINSFNIAIGGSDYTVNELALEQLLKYIEKNPE